MRILYTCFNPPWQGGGTFYRAFGFGKELAARGHDVTILTTSVANKWRWERAEQDGVKLALAPSLTKGSLRSGYDFMEARRRSRWVKSQPNFDIVHGFECRPNVIYPTLKAHQTHNATLILDWCDWFGRGGSVEERKPLQRAILRPLETYYEEHFRPLAQGTTVINEPLRQRALGLGVADGSILWLPNGAEVDKFRPINRQAAQSQLNLDPNKRYIGHLGQAFPRDAMLMGEAFGHILAERDDVDLILIGNHKTDIAARFANKHRVIETGFISDEDLNLYLGACDMLWLPLSDTIANRGRWPMKVNDYMSSGRASVTTNVGDWVRLYRGERKIGRIAIPNTVDFAQQTLSLLRNAGERVSAETNARWQVDNHFAWSLVTDKLEGFYNDIHTKSQQNNFK